MGPEREAHRRGIHGVVKGSEDGDISGLAAHEIYAIYLLWQKAMLWTTL